MAKLSHNFNGWSNGDDYLDGFDKEDRSVVRLMQAALTSTHSCDQPPDNWFHYENEGAGRCWVIRCGCGEVAHIDTVGLSKAVRWMHYVGEIVHA